MAVLYIIIIMVNQDEIDCRKEEQFFCEKIRVRETSNRTGTDVTGQWPHVTRHISIFSAESCPYMQHASEDPKVPP